MKDIFKQIERVLIVIGVLLSFLAFLEVLRAYETLTNFHPWAGYAFLGFLAVLIFYLVWQIKGIFSYPRAPQRPEFSNSESPDSKEINSYITFFYQISGRLSRNQYLLEQAADEILKLNDKITTFKKSVFSSQDIINELEKFESENFDHLIAKLDKRAEKIVSDNVGLVSVGTALSPYKSVDLYIVLARNFRMIQQIIKTYRTRPTLRETARIFYDIARVVTTINLLNITDNIWAGIGRHIPIIGRYGEAAAEGLFSGLLTSVAGHAAIDRCRSYKKWSNDEALQTYRKKMDNWGKDVLNILKHHFIDNLKRNPFKDTKSGENIENEEKPEKDKLLDRIRKKNKKDDES